MRRGCRARLHPLGRMANSAYARIPLAAPLASLNRASLPDGSGKHTRSRGHHYRGVHHDESPSVGQAALRALQGHPARARRDGHLQQEPQAQAAAGLSKARQRACTRSGFGGCPGAPSADVWVAVCPESGPLRQASATSQHTSDGDHQAFCCGRLPGRLRIETNKLVRRGAGAWPESPGLTSPAKSASKPR